MNIFNRNKPHIGILKLTLVEKFDCQHVVTTFQYGGHPMRVYAFCPFCQKMMRLDWKDTTARLSNRLWGTIPMLIQTSLLFIALLYLAIALLSSVKIRKRKKNLHLTH